MSIKKEYGIYQKVYSALLFPQWNKMFSVLLKILGNNLKQWFPSTCIYTQMGLIFRWDIDGENANFYASIYIHYFYFPPL